jgi:hypothetical protein
LGAYAQQVNSTFLTAAEMGQFVITFDGTAMRLYRYLPSIAPRVVSQNLPSATNLSNWDIANYPLVIGNEVTLNQSWRGTIHQVAVYDRALTQAEIAQNFNAGLNQP